MSRTDTLLLSIGFAIFAAALIAQGVYVYFERRREAERENFPPFEPRCAVCKEPGLMFCSNVPVFWKQSNIRVSFYLCQGHIGLWERGE